MNDRKGFFQRAADRIKNRKPNMIERGPEMHPDDDRMHISGKVDGISRNDDGSTGRDRAGADIERGSFDGSR
jgi:hypothetical protein